MFHVIEQGFLAMNETHGMILQKLDEILNKLDNPTSNQVNNQAVGSEGDVDLVNTESQPHEPYGYPDLTQNPEYDQFMFPQFAPLKPQRKPNKHPHNLGDYDFFLYVIIGLCLKLSIFKGPTRSSQSKTCWKQNIDGTTEKIKLMVISKEIKHFEL